MLVDDQRLESLPGVDLDISYLVEDLCVIAKDGAKDGIMQCPSGRYARKMSVQKDVLSCRMDVRDAMSSGGLASRGRGQAGQRSARAGRPAVKQSGRRRSTAIFVRRNKANIFLKYKI